MRWSSHSQYPGGASEKDASMATKKGTTSARKVGSDGTAALLRQYGCGPVPLTAADDALYERHLLFDHVVAVTDAGPRERFESFARSVRDVLCQRWVRTEETYARENPKRVYYLSMEFLIGRSLSNNITNLLLEPIVKQAAAARKRMDWLNLLEEE